MRDLVKRYINSFPNYESDEIIKKMKAFSVVSFDIFDTLVKRNVLDKNDIFDLVEKAYNKRKGQCILGFKGLRLQAEEYVRKDKINQEYTIDDIYERMLGKKINTENHTFVVNATLAKELMGLEIEIEIAVSQPNYRIKKVFEYCKDQGKKILLISDMYLPQKYVEELLSKNGYFGYNALYVSCEFDVSKRDKGKLFEKVSAIEGVDKSNWIHIGDSKKADWLFARTNGIKSVSIARYEHNADYIITNRTPDFQLSVLFAFINNNIDNIDNFDKADTDTFDTVENLVNSDLHDKKIGYAVYGLILYFFVKWLKNNLNSDKTTLFFARDCYVVKQAYELLGGSNEKNKYFLASRKSLLVPELKDDASLNHVVSLLKSDPKQFTVSFSTIKV